MVHGDSLQTKYHLAGLIAIFNEDPFFSRFNELLHKNKVMHKEF